MNIRFIDFVYLVILAALAWFGLIEPRLDPAPIAQQPQPAPYVIDAINGPTAQAHDPVNVGGVQVEPAPAVIEVTATDRPSLNEFLGLPAGSNAGARNTLIPIP